MPFISLGVIRILKFCLKREAILLLVFTDMKKAGLKMVFGNGSVF